MVKIDKDEFNQKMFTRIFSLIEDYHLINENENIAIGLSGGKDSVLTLYALSEYKKRCNFDFNLVAIAVDEGINGYRESGISSAVKNAEICNVDLIVESFKDNFDYNLDDIYMIFKSACIPCGVFRRHILNKVSYEWGADKIATGHNLDDEIQSFLMSFARGDTLKFSKFGPELNKIDEKLVPRIKPLWNTPEKEVGMWAVINDIDIHLEECPYSSLSLRSKIKSFLNNAENSSPGLKQNILSSFIKSLNVEAENPKLYECVNCGEPTSSNICKACEILDLLKNS